MRTGMNVIFVFSYTFLSLLTGLLAVICFSGIPPPNRQVFSPFHVRLYVAGLVWRRDSSRTAYSFR
jgi:hypothetical protein